jgi:DNA polymerase III alpha subunit (gram-positive type)
MILAAFDFETTGLDKDKDRVVESAVVLYSTGHKRVLESVGMLIKSDVKITPEITSITGIQQSAVDHFGYEESSAIETLFELFSTADAVIGHNVRSFDWPFAEKWAKRLGVSIPQVFLVDTFEDIPGAEPQALITMMAKAGILLTDAHSAYADAYGSLKLALAHGYENVVEYARIPTVAVQSHAPRTQTNRENKEAKFRWNPEYKIWWKAVKETEIEQLARKVPFSISVVDKSIPLEYLRNS